MSLYAVYIRPRKPIRKLLCGWHWVSFVCNLKTARQKAQHYREGDWKMNDLQTVILYSEGVPPFPPFIYRLKSKKWQIAEKIL